MTSDAQLLEMSPKDLLKLPGIGKVAVTVISEAVQAAGGALAPNPTPKPRNAFQRLTERQRALSVDWGEVYREHHGGKAYRWDLGLPAALSRDYAALVALDQQVRGEDDVRALMGRFIVDGASTEWAPTVDRLAKRWRDLVRASTVARPGVVIDLQVRRDMEEAAEVMRQIRGGRR